MAARFSCRRTGWVSTSWSTTSAASSGVAPAPAARASRSSVWAVVAKGEVAVERRNLSPAALYEEAVRRAEAAIVSTGALTAETGKHTGRSPKDKFFVKEPTSQDAIWWHPGNQPIASAKFDQLLARTEEFAATHEVFTHDVSACADPRYRLRVRVVTELAWHSLFARNLCIRPNTDALVHFQPD